MSNIRKVLGITGIRSDYDILYPVFKLLQDSPDFELSLAVSSAHLSDWHGYTLAQIERDGFAVADKLDTLLMTNRLTQRAKGVGLLTYSLSQCVERIEPDILLVLGDREESIATAIVGNYMNVCTVHVGGGDPVYGNADDPMRWAASRLAHIHLTIAQEYADNLMKAGEEAERVFWVGNPAYWNIAQEPDIRATELTRSLGISLETPFVYLIKHPLSSEVSRAGGQMECALSALAKFADKNNIQVLASYPNTDPGAYDVVRAIERYKENRYFHFFKTLSRPLFVNLMRRTLALVGNSSMGILEAPFYKLPVVNIGNRQLGRLNAGNVEFVTYSEEVIICALEKACFDRDYRDYVANLTNPYGDESAPQKVLDVMREVDVHSDKILTKKKFVSI